MPLTTIEDINGDTLNCTHFRGKNYPIRPGHDLDGVLTNLPDLQCRDDDVTIVAFPKSGTHWVWEICNMVLSGKFGIPTEKSKMNTMMELVTKEELHDVHSVRILNTHVTPELYPTNLISRKSKIIYIYRNPKDSIASFFHHIIKIKPINYSGNWNGYFELALAGKVLYGSWFEFTKAWESFFLSHKDIPVLRMCYEILKQDSLAGVHQIAEFLEVERNSIFLKTVNEKCTFDSMKQGRKLNSSMRPLVKTSEHHIFRKGIIGDWKNHFTVAQNHRFDEEYTNEMKGYSFEFENYM